MFKIGDDVLVDITVLDWNDENGILTIANAEGVGKIVGFRDHKNSVVVEFTVRDEEYNIVDQCQRSFADHELTKIEVF